MPRNDGYLSYHKSVTAEFKAIQDRIRYFIGSAHWGEDGRFKEILLINHLKKVLPSNVSVGTGFVRNRENITKQIDIIVYDNKFPTLFSEGDFVVVLPESVYGIIEIKSKINSNRKLIEAIEKSKENGEVIGTEIFNGLFGYDSSIRFENEFELGENLKEALINNDGYLNHVAFGPNIFMKYWEEGNPVEDDGIRTFSFYSINGLSYGYFISNLVDFINKKSNGFALSEEFQNFLYPIQEGKETHRLKQLEIKLLEDRLT
jgi:hypothetical protein